MANNSGVAFSLLFSIFLVVGQRGWCGVSSRAGLSVDFTQRRTNLQTNDVLVKPSFSCVVLAQIGFLVCLIHLIFTIDNYILKKK